MTNWPLLLGLPLWFWLFILPAIVSLSCRLTRFHIQPLLKPIWRLLDRVYLVSGIIAAIFMITILVIIIVQMAARWINIPFEGSTEFAGYAMAATSFFALAHALSRGAHIRVSILLNLNRFTRLWLDAFAMLIAAITATYFARFAVKTNFMSEILNDRTQGQDQIPEWVLTCIKMFGSFPTEWGTLWANTSSKLVYTPVWVPQIPMSIGTILLAVALWDHLIRLLVTSETAIKGETVE
jgi:TRAP-type C4-dicarboxylate transport system permease small subunit